MRKALISGSLILSLFTAKSQTGLVDVDLEDVIVTADMKKRDEAAAGTKVTRISHDDIKTNLTKSLSEILLESSPIQIKSMGQGALATASFRGASSSHTQVMWNGISLNSPQLGNFDLSQVPIYFVDDISLYHGGSAQKEGSGALGGSINFSNEAYYGDKPSGSVLLEAASNETYTGGLNLKFSKNGFSSATRAYYQQSENNYRYLNKVFSNVHTYERRKNADYKQAGIMQELYYKTRKGDMLSLMGWWQADNRSLPQSIIVYDMAHEKNNSRNLRTMAAYDMKRKNHALKFSAAYLHGSMEYTRSFGEMVPDTSNNINSSMIAGADYTYSGFKNIILSGILTYRHDKVESDNYISSKERNTVNATIAASWRITKKLHIDARIPLEWNDETYFARYNVSGRYRLIDEWLTLKASNGYNYRVPTLNDLYWNPGGNPYLKPEKGFSSDFSVMTEPTFGTTHLKLEATYFYMNIDDWIMWVPKGNGYIWEPVNFNNVISQGIEFAGDLKFATGKISHIFSGNYAWIRSVDNSYRQEGTQGKQLPYIPRNRWNAGYRFNFNDKLRLHYNASFTDARFTSADESYQTEAYISHNAEVGYNMKLKSKMNIDFSVKADNIFNAYYESTQYYPMPLRMFWGRVIYSF